MSYYILIIIVILSFGEPAVTVKKYIYNDKWECLNAGFIKYNTLRKKYKEGADIIWHCSSRNDKKLK